MAISLEITIIHIWHPSYQSMGRPVTYPRIGKLSNRVSRILCRLIPTVDWILMKLKKNRTTYRHILISYLYIFHHHKIAKIKMRNRMRWNKLGTCQYRTTIKIHETKTTRISIVWFNKLVPEIKFLQICLKSNKTWIGKVIECKKISLSSKR